MEFHLWFPTIVAITFTITIVASLIHVVKGTWAKRGKKIEPPQAKGAWPIIGHLHLLGGSHLPHFVLGDMADEHGPIFTIRLGIHQALVVSDWKMAKDCFTTNDKAFASRPKSEAIKLMAYNYATFGFALYGDYWRQVRKIIMLEVLSQQRVEMLGRIRVSEVRTSIKDIYDVWVENKESENADEVKVEMSQWFGNLMVNIMVRILSGKRFLPNDDEGVRFQLVVKKFYDLVGAFVVSDFIPYLKWLDVGGYIKAMKKTAKDFDNIFDGWLKEHKIERESEQQREGSQVFMSVLISILEGASEEDFHGFDQDTVIKATCQQLLVAGLDTTSLTLTWALSLLLNNPKALKIAHDEIDEHVGRDRLVEESDLKNLVYLDAIIKETLRLYPAGPLSVPHESMEDCVVGGYNIPKGTRLLVNLWKLHRDPNIWSDPSEVRPERFLASHKDIDVKGKHFELLPFGSGRRMCPGIFFSLQALRLTLASLIQQFVLKRPSKEPIDMTETSGLTNSKATPLEVLLSPRLSFDMYCVGS
ncbi:cytochrome P450 CYP82D47-like [Cynara cardunculus var. scolymus]|uniref:Cytochrome P450 n=1 Tax=Cynara cardunculus var. scolymus TaxID=59895 RepID=A0A124SGJ7_CYNCS|nr:cytochrome P450 CYP82D47-like [Cynara cardunculus var. scolymus]KVI06601.1 cytochrome P450 [Cynara cardunculus var. scolymus]